MAGIPMGRTTSKKGRFMLPDGGDPMVGRAGLAGFVQQIEIDGQNRNRSQAAAGPSTPQSGDGGEEFSQHTPMAHVAANRDVWGEMLDEPPGVSLAGFSATSTPTHKRPSTMPHASPLKDPPTDQYVPEENQVSMVVQTRVSEAPPQLDEIHELGPTPIQASPVLNAPNERAEPSHLSRYMSARTSSLIFFIFASITVANIAIGLYIMDATNLESLLEADQRYGGFDGNGEKWGDHRYGMLGLLNVERLGVFHGSVWPDDRGMYIVKETPAKWHHSLSSEPSDVLTSSDNEICDEGTLLDCTGDCVDAYLWGDGTCDLQFDCELSGFDNGDCEYTGDSGSGVPTVHPASGPKDHSHNASSDALGASPGAKPQPAPTPASTTQPEPAPVSPKVDSPSAVPHTPSPTPTTPTPAPATTPDPSCIDHYTNCQDIVKLYSCELDLASLGQNNHQRLSDACCGTCTGMGFQFGSNAESGLASVDIHNVTAIEASLCINAYDFAYSGPLLSTLEDTDYGSCCHRCSEHFECLAWTYTPADDAVHDVGVCRLLSSITERNIPRARAVSGGNFCWRLQHEAYSRCCEDLGIDCQASHPSTCSNECQLAADLFLAHCPTTSYTHFGSLFRHVYNLCHTTEHELQACSQASALNYIAAATEDDGSCVFPAAHASRHAPMPPPPVATTEPQSFAGCPYTHCCGGNEVDGWHVTTCIGSCMPVQAIFNSVCDEEFNCPEYEHDRSQCARQASGLNSVPDGVSCQLEPDFDANCVHLVHFCHEESTRHRCPTTCAFGDYALACLDPCRCSQNGLSGFVEAAAGCGYHDPGYDAFCFVADPLHCATGLPSQHSQEAKWRYCNPTQEINLVRTCFDRIQNQGEVDIDCGGPCANCGTCSDGVINPGEDLVDCGGRCDPCPCAVHVFGTEDAAGSYAVDGEYIQITGAHQYHNVDDGIVATITWSDNEWTIIGMTGPVYRARGTSAHIPPCGWERIPLTTAQVHLPNVGPCDGDAPMCSACYDGVHTAGEEDVDCGGPCDPCPTCHDGILNQREELVDCGGPCDPCVGDCTDGIQNRDEERIDCGGVCGNCATCHDGVRNQGEVGVDCGGPCPQMCTACACTTTGQSGLTAIGISGCGTWHGSADAFCYVVDPEDCPSSHASRSHPGAAWRYCDADNGGAMVDCDDGYQQSGEESTDCGGPCNPCPSCSDGVRNQGEQDVDCGGPGCNPCLIQCNPGERYERHRNQCLADDEWCSVQYGPSHYAYEWDLCICNDEYIWESGAGGMEAGTGHCVNAICADGVMNGDEEDVDCGGTCDPCDACLCSTTGVSGSVATPFIGCAQHADGVSNTPFGHCYVVRPAECLAGRPIVDGQFAGAGWRSCLPAVVSVPGQHVAGGGR